MRWLEGTFKGYDGANLFYRLFEPARPRHTLVILHGYGEHSGRYLKFPEMLRVDAVRVAVMDLRGMGRSGTNVPEAETVEEFLKDVDCFSAHLRQFHGVTDPLIVLGHSMGGLLALEWALLHPEAVKRLILSAPFLGLKGLRLCRLFNAILRLFLPGYVYRNPVLPKFLSHDVDEVNAYRNDPLIKRSISAALIGSIMERIVRLHARETVTLPFPAHFLTAGEERIVDPDAVRTLFDRLAAPRKEWTGFEGFYHEIFNETGQGRAFNVLKTILEECV